LKTFRFFRNLLSIALIAIFIGADIVAMQEAAASNDYMMVVVCAIATIPAAFIFAMLLTLFFKEK
jgi:hypothetical protein